MPIKDIENSIINNNNIPKHIAIIMDGNGRWAKAHSLPRIAGHKEGIDSVRAITKNVAILVSNIYHYILSLLKIGVDH